MANHAHPESTVKAVGKAVRAGQLSRREVSRKYEVDESTIRYWEKKYGWKSDLAPAVRREAKRRSMTPENQAPAQVRAGAKAAAMTVMDISDDEIIDEFANQGAAVLRVHRKQLGMLRDKMDQLYRDLSKNRRYCMMLAHQMLAARDPKKPGSVATFLMDQTAKQTQCFRDLAQAMARVVPLERQAYSLDKGEDEGSYEDQLSALHDWEPKPGDNDSPPIH